MKNQIGVDISLNSTAITIDQNSHYTFLLFPGNYSDKKLETSDAILYSKFNQFQNFNTYNCYRQFHQLSKKGKDDFNFNENVKLQDALNTSRMISSALESHLLTETPVFNIESYSYGSKGSSLIDIVTASTLIRKELSNLGVTNFIPPTSLKKYIGKPRDEKTGNASKLEIFYFFCENILDDDQLATSEIYQWIVNNQDKCLTPSRKIRKPIDDLIDSYFLAKFLF